MVGVGNYLVVDGLGFLYVGMGIMDGFLCGVMYDVVGG